MEWNEAIEELEERRKKAKLGGGQAAIDKQHEKGKLTARERLDILFDEGTFVEINDLAESRIDDFGLDKKRVPGDGVITGYGKINGRTVFASSEDFTVIGGSLGEYHSRKIVHIQDMALKMKCPIITINDSGGARIEEGIDSLSGYSGIFERNTIASGVIPQIAVILGPCSGGACYSPAICDYIFVVEDISKMFITGPQVVKTVIGEELTADELGGALTHAEKSGVAHFYYKSEKNCLGGVRELLHIFRTIISHRFPVKPGKAVNQCRSLANIVPDNKKKSYDVHDVINAMIDRESFFEVQKHWAKNAVVGFGRIDGNTVGFVCNQAKHKGGSLDIDASDKIARFIRFCDCFNIPIVSLGGCTGIFAGLGAGAQWNNKTWCKDSFCLCGGYRSKDYAYNEKGLRRSLYRDELKAYGGRHSLCMADCRDCGNGSRGCCQYHRSKTDKRGRGSRSKTRGAYRKI